MIPSFAHWLTARLKSRKVSVQRNVPRPTLKFGDNGVTGAVAQKPVVLRVKQGVGLVLQETTAKEKKMKENHAVQIHVKEFGDNGVTGAVAPKPVVLPVKQGVGLVLQETTAKEKKMKENHAVQNHVQEFGENGATGALALNPMAEAVKLGVGLVLQQITAKDHQRRQKFVLTVLFEQGLRTEISVRILVDFTPIHQTVENTTSVSMETPCPTHALREPFTRPPLKDVTGLTMFSAQYKK